MNNPFVHLELNTTDTSKAKYFYTEMFGWSMQDTESPAGVYSMFRPAEAPGGGLMKHPVPGAPSLWLPYMGVEEIDAATEKAVELGARLLKEATEVPGRGWFSILEDPTGAAFGLWQNQAH